MGKVTVVGAGPAGSVSAISAIKAGHEVSLYEEHECAGAPSNCSGLISKEGLESLSKFVDYKKHSIHKIRGALIDFAGFQLKVDSGKDIAYVINRASFDADLAAKAEREGAKLLYNTRAEPPFPDGAIIGADGAYSSVAKYFMFPQIPKFASTSRAKVKFQDGMEDFVRVFLSNEKFPGFFGWIIPHDEENAEIGAGCLLPGNPNRALESLSKQAGIPLPHERSHFVIPLAQRPLTAAKIRGRSIILVGDAAGHVKSTTGGGVVFGTHCAMIAGRCAENPEKYEMLWKENHGKELDAHFRIRSALSHFGDDSLRALGTLASTLKVEKFLEENGNMDRPTEMACPGLLLHPLRFLFPKNGN